MGIARTKTTRADCVVSWHNPPLLEIVAQRIVVPVSNTPFLVILDVGCARQSKGTTEKNSGLEPADLLGEGKHLLVDQEFIETVCRIQCNSHRCPLRWLSPKLRPQWRREDPRKESKALLLTPAQLLAHLKCHCERNKDFDPLWIEWQILPLRRSVPGISEGHNRTTLARSGASPILNSRTKVCVSGEKTVATPSGATFVHLSGMTFRMLDGQCLTCQKVDANYWSTVSFCALM
jgi:hypothetical protein